MIIKCVQSGGLDYDESLKIYINGKCLIHAYDMSECPEDANLCRDLNFVYDIPDLLRSAYEAGKNGEELEMICEDEDED